MTRKYNKFEFGFLNNAQDPTDIGNNESPDANNLDPDKLALGSLEHSQPASQGTLKDFTTTEMGGREFFLGDVDDNDTYTTYDGNGYYYSDQTWFEIPTGLLVSTGSRAPDVGFTMTFDVRFSNTASGFVLGNVYGANADDGQVKFSVLGTALVAEISNSGTGVILLTAIPSVISTDTWYRVVFNVAINATTELHTVYVDGKLADQASTTYASPTDNPRPSGLFIGGNTVTSGANFDLKNTSIISGAASTPSQWDGSIKSLGFTNNHNVIFSSRNGSAYNKQDIPFWFSGTQPTVSSLQTKAAGRLFVEINSAEQTLDVPDETEFEVTPSATQEGITVDQGLNFGEAVFLGFRIRKIVQDYPSGAQQRTRIFNFENSGGVTGTMYLELDDNSLILYGPQPLAGSFPSEPIKYTFLAGESITLAFVFTNESTVSEDLFRFKAYVNGEQVYTDNETSSTIWDIFNNQRFVEFPNTVVSSTGTPTLRYTLRDFYVGNIKATANPEDLAQWAGSKDFLSERVDILLSAPDGDLANNEQGFSTSNPGSTTSPSLRTDTPLTNLGKIRDPLADNIGPTVPDMPTSAVQEFLRIDDGELQNAVKTSGTAPSFNPKLELIPGRAYNGPDEASVVFGVIKVSTATFDSASREIEVTYRVDGQSGFPNRITRFYQDGSVKLNHYNLQLSLDIDTTYTFEDGYACQINSPTLLDGKYQYKAVAIRHSDTSPKVFIESNPSKVLDVNLNNIDAAGQRVANNIPIITIPAASPGYPNFNDRIDLYRKDPDADEYIKVTEHSSPSPYSYRDNTLITELPKIEFLRTEDDETFSKLDEATGNDSGTYFMLFNKDNRLWAVPSDRKDLLLYSRENDWWGWRRENSFSFNGDITDVVTIRDINVVSGESTLVVFTTKGIYHVVGSGVESSPYTRVPMFGGDGSTDINTYAGSALPFNGSIFFMAKSTDGNYETGAYGQKIYEYNLQQLVELSGRCKESAMFTLDTNELEFASLIGGDKYIIKKLTTNECLMYHKDARAWVTFDDDGSPTDNWSWESKHFERSMAQQGTFLDARAFRIDYEGDVTLTFYMKPHGKDAFVSKQKVLSNVGRTKYENLMPANMGEEAYFTLTGTSTSKVYNMWFVS